MLVDGERATSDIWALVSIAEASYPGSGDQIINQMFEGGLDFLWRLAWPDGSEAISRLADLFRQAGFAIDEKELESLRTRADHISEPFQDLKIYLGLTDIASDKIKQAGKIISETLFDEISNFIFSSKGKETLVTECQKSDIIAKLEVFDYLGTVCCVENHFNNVDSIYRFSRDILGSFYFLTMKERLDQLSEDAKTMLRQLMNEALKEQQVLQSDQVV